MQKKVPYVAQLGNMDCSIACMTMLFRYYGLDVDIVDVGQVVHIGRDGVNLTQLKQATQQFGFKCTAYRYNKQKNILDSNLPAVVYSGSHLAVIGSKTVLGQYILLDPIKGKSIVNFEQIHDTFSDILITIRPEKRIKRKKCKPKLKVAINYKLVAGIISLMLLIINRAFDCRDACHNNDSRIAEPHPPLDIGSHSRCESISTDWSMPSFSSFAAAVRYT